jgi:hypothetical protein
LAASTSRVSAQARLWSQIDQRLAAHAVNDAEAARIRARIAQHVPRPAPDAAAETEHEQRMLELQTLLRAFGPKSRAGAKTEVSTAPVNSAAVLYATSTLERCFRDAPVITQHIAGSSTRYEQLGRFFMGLKAGPR